VFVRCHRGLRLTMFLLEYFTVTVWSVTYNSALSMSLELKSLVMWKTLTPNKVYNTTCLDPRAFGTWPLWASAAKPEILVTGCAWFVNNSALLWSTSYMCRVARTHSRYWKLIKFHPSSVSAISAIDDQLQSKSKSNFPNHIH